MDDNVLLLFLESEDDLETEELENQVERDAPMIRLMYRRRYTNLQIIGMIFAMIVLSPIVLPLFSAYLLWDEYIG